MSSDAPSPATTALERLIQAEGALSILMPAHNLEAVIATNLRRVHAFFSRFAIPFEILAIDDGSTDGTAGQIRRAEQELPHVRGLYLEQNMGKGAALRAGFERARGAFILFLDADLDLPPEQAVSFFEVMETTGADAVIGSKRHPASRLHYPLLRRIVSTGYYRFIKLAFGLPLRDTQTGLKLFRRAPLAYAFPRMLVKAFAFDLELLALIHHRGFSIAEAPVQVVFHGTLGGLSWQAVRSVLNDTLAVFYRLYLLRYYDAIPDVHLPHPLPSVTVLIACPAETEYLHQALRALSRQTIPPQEILLLPDHPSGHPWPYPVREIPTGRLRPAEKRNVGIREAQGEIIAFLDDDAYPSPDWLERALPYFSLPGVVGVGGPAVTPPDDPFLAQLSGAVYSRRIVSGDARFRYLPGRVRETDDLPSCNLLARAESLRAAGGFRTDFWPGEDTLLCLDLVHRQKGRLFYEPRALVFHHRRPLFLPHLRQVGRYALHRGFFVRRFPPNSRRLAYFLPSAWLVFLVCGALAAALWPPARLLWIPTVLLYLLLTLLFSFERQPIRWFLVWLGILTTHLVYGWRFLQGLAGLGLPRRPAPFDHPSEQRRAPEGSPPCVS